MDYEIIGATVALLGALLWIRRDLRHDIAEIRADVRIIHTRIDGINQRIDAVLLADRRGAA